MRKSKQPAESPPDDRLRVVIADDASAMRALLRRMLEDTAAFEIVGEASDGSEAVEMTGALHPDLVVLDLSMPVMDGLSAIPAIRRVSPLTRIVVLSALEPDRVREQAMTSGADAFIEKCLVADSLAQRLVEACWSPPGDESVVLPTDSPSADPARGSAEHPAGAGADVPGMEWFRLAFDHAPTGMALLDLHGRLEQANDAFCRIVARSPAEVVGTAVDVISHPGDVDRHAEHRRRMLAGGRNPVQDEHRFIRADGHIAWAVMTTSLLLSGDGSPARFLCQALDVSDRKQAEATSARAEELKERYEKELARSNAELAQFATVAAHDLKSPLQVISGFAGLLEQTQGELLDERGQEFLGFILRGATRMNVLIDDLLAYAKVGVERRLRVEVPLDRVFDEVLASLDEAEIAAAGGSVERDSLPVVTGDPALFAHVIQNLVTNGLKFVSPGVPPRVRVTASRMINAWCVDVADNGIGIDPQHRSQIFGMFQRLHKNEYEGTGIGLSICKRIVEQQGGSIWVEERAGGGSRFRFTVPDQLGAHHFDDPLPLARTGQVRPEPVAVPHPSSDPGSPPSATRSADGGSSAPGAGPESGG